MHGTPEDVALARALAALGNPTRLELLRKLRSPKALREIDLKPGRDSRPDDDYRKMSRQSVRDHLDRLEEVGAVVSRDAEREYGTTSEYVLNHQAIYALAEEVRALAALRPAAELEVATAQGTPAPKGRALADGPCLVLVKGLDEGRIFALDSPASGRREWVIGRRRGLDVALDFDPFVSTENARVVWEGGAHFLEDLPDSRNGTWLNFAPLPKAERRALRTGDVVGVGRSLLMFRS